MGSDSLDNKTYVQNAAIIAFKNANINKLRIFSRLME